MHDADILQLSRDGAIATVTMNNPERLNAYSPIMRHALHEQFHALMADTSLRCIILTGAGGNFSAGGDIKAFKPLPILELREILQESQRLLRSILFGPKPVIAAVEGYAYGAGLALAAACDFVVASNAAKFSAAFIKIGLVPDVSSMWTLTQRIGMGRAKEMLMLGSAVDAAEGHRIGLVNRLCEPGEALQAAQKVALQFADGPPIAQALVKAAFANGVPTITDAWRAELDYVPVAMRSEDFAEGRASFFEKRKPVFKGT